MKFAWKAAFVMLAMALAVGAPARAQIKGKVSPEELKPPADILIDCAKAPKGAVRTLPHELAAWAAVYCTRHGQIFNANDRFFGAFPDSGLRATFGAAEIDNVTGVEREKAYFKSIAYAPLPDADLQKLLQVDPISAKIVTGKKLYRLDLTTGAGNSVVFLVIDPLADPFWVFPLTDKGLGSPAYFVVSLAALNRTR